MVLFFVMEVPSVAELKAEAESLGLKSQEVVSQYVMEQQAYYRDERAKEREVCAKELEARVAKEAQEFSLREAELRLSLLRAEAEANSASSAPPTAKLASVRLPTFTEGDYMSSFLCRFF